ncbi:hypothetical protein [Thermocatellispora tengchongensis]|uniref:hypothetical protein n=1 Tax=Thermocatellispora tengchongensis TaxID=1073253 RepID=UPI0036368E72
MTPERAIRARSAWPRPPVIPLRSAHNPHASDTPGNPRARRHDTNASKNAFPAAYAP